MKKNYVLLSACFAVLHRKEGSTNNPGRKKTSIAKIGLILFAYLITCTVTASAQGPQFDWAKAMSGNVWDNGYAITVDNEGNSYTTGLYRGDTLDCDPGPGVFDLTPAGTSGNNLFISKLDAAGNFVWAKGFTSTRLNYSYSIAHDAADNIYVTGYFYDSLDFDPGPNSFVLHSAPSGLSIQTSDAFILKLDSAGNFLWAKNIGGSNNDMAYSVAVDSLNEVYVTGKFFDTVDFDPGPDTFNIMPLTSSANIFVLKLDSSGQFIWARNMGAPSTSAATGSNGVGYSVAVDAGGNVYSTGYFSDTINFNPNGGQADLVANGTTVNFDIYISKLDASGNFAWAKSIGSPLTDQGAAIALDPASNVYVTGTFKGTADFDPGPDTFNLSASATQNSDMFVLKLDSAGNFLWAKDIGGVTYSAFSNNAPYSIITDRAGNSYTAGDFWGYAYFDTGSAGSLNSIGASDIFILKMNPSGVVKWVKQMGGTNIDVAHSLAMDASGDIYTTGWFEGTSNFNPNATNANADDTLTSVTANSADIMVVKLSCGDTTSATVTDTVDCTGYTLNGTTYLQSGTYVQAIPNVQGCDSIITLHLTIIPVLNINITENANVLGTVDHYTTYQWILNGAAITGATDSTYTVTQNGGYQVAVTNANGCTDTSNVYTVTDAAGIENISSLTNDISIYPNPSSSMIYIKAPVNVNVTLTDITGSTLKQLKNAHSISLNDFADGVYFLRITDKNNIFIKVEKVIKQSKQ